MTGLLLGGMVSDRFGPRVAVGASLACLAAGALLTGSPPVWFDLLMAGGGIALAVSNGLVAHADWQDAGRWLNFTHAFYRGGTLVLGLMLIPSNWAIWLSLMFAALALAILAAGKPPTANREAPRERAGTSRFTPALLVLTFLAGAAEIWAAKEAAILLGDRYPYVGAYVAGAMFLGRLAASSAFFSGRRQLLISSMATAMGLALLHQASGNLQLLAAIVTAFFSASLFPSALGLLARRARNGLATTLAFGQCAAVLAAPLAADLSGYAILPAILLALIFAHGVARGKSWLGSR